ncbi:paired amphipathic helix protein Sin3-like 2 isoform X1 [Rhodamnia argentea]|uniref:Paired amphipathic helix protein Sin3-like 2 isoform X1 n=1 Tax=Rhodamnia argentea TaxID=178133 RepID=A0A8B8R2A7_9MYRT|nr:paired amphipathic helix protein Sin3-like 2 isoform X1 [Rhodamnia argentea]XP_030553615.2 paired amphipathic helix protein Sin3-like 2 isoform X1 [Rhodamnia argentea]
MKRIRDDVYPDSQFKRPFGSSKGELYGQSQVPAVGMGGGGGVSASQKLTTDDALTYLKEVKDMFQDQREKYDMFLEVMKDFKAQRTDTVGVIARVKELFKGHNNLILGFNTFLPKGYEITLDEDEAPTKRTVEFEEAISFVNKIKKRFQNDEHVYKSFLEILNMYRKEHKDINEVYSEVASLFEDHADLLEEFTRFLPDNSATPLAHNIPYSQNSLQHYNERNMATPAMRQMHSDKQCHRRDRIIASDADRDLSVDRPDVEDEKSMIKVHRDQKKRLERDNRDRINREQDDRESGHDNKDLHLQRSSDKRKSSRKVEGFGMNANVPFADDKNALKSMYNEGFIFCEKVKERLGSSDDYQAFLKCLHMYSNGIIKRIDLQNLVTDLLGKFPDLMDEFNDFLERCENIDGFLAGVMSKKSLSCDSRVPRSVKAEDRDKEQKREPEGTKDKERHKEKYMWKSIQELDLSDCQRCTPSYRLLPEDYPIPSASQRSEVGAQVLNDHWVSVTSGSEDYSFKHMRRNQYEESLFRCEDDRFELDMLLESVSSTSKRAEELLNNISDNIHNMETSIHVENYFTALNLRCIERLYGDHGLDVLEILRKNPTLALPVILIRLKQKQEEWTKCRSDFNKVWADIYAKNHYKSLDHRSFYFKQQDSKNLSTKSLVAEIREMKEKRQKEDDSILAIAAANRQPIVPHFEYLFSDGSIHEDLHKLVKYSCEEVCSTKEQLNKVMRLWTTFLEPMLSIPCRSHKKGSAEVVGKTISGARIVTSSKGVEINGSPEADGTRVDLKHPKPVDSRTENISSGASTSRINLPNGNMSIKENSCLDPEHARGDDSGHCVHFPGKELKNADVTEEMSRLKIEAGSAEPATDDAKLANSENCFGRVKLPAMSGGDVPPCNSSNGASEDRKVDVVPLLEAGTATKVAGSGLLEEGTKANRYNGNSFGSPKIEKEEGELSPVADYEEDNSAANRDGGAKALPKANCHADDRENHPVGVEQACNRDGRRRNHADEEDSEDVSETGDVSGSNSAGDECSHEENEEEEDVDHDDDGKAESEDEAEGTSDAPRNGDSASLPLSERFLSSVKPLSKRVLAVLPAERKCSQIFYGNDDFYVLFRLHQILYERILSAKTNSINTDRRRISEDIGSPDPYARFMRILYNLLDGTIDNAKFEDECRDIIGNQSYVLFTLDKLIYKLVKQLQLVASDDMDNKLLQLFDYEKSRKSARFVDPVYYENARIFLHDENIYRIEFSFAAPSLSIQLMDNPNEKPEVFAVCIDPNFAAYLHNDYLIASPIRKEPHDIFLSRNKRKYAGLDENSVFCMALEGIHVVNGLECKVACNSSKTSYVLDTEDFLFRWRRRRKSSPGFRSSSRYQEKVQRFHRFLSTK